MAKSLVALTACAVLLTLNALPAQAQSPQDDNAPDTDTVQLSSFVSMGSPFSSRVGAAVAFAWTEKIGIEAEVGYRRAELNALSAHVSLLYQLARIGRVKPYLAAGVGLEQYGTARELPNGSLGTQARTALSINAGGGITVPVDGNWGIRTDARWFNGLGTHAPEHWRLYNGVTLAAGRR